MWYFTRRGHAAYKALTMQIFYTLVQALWISIPIAMGIGAAINIIASPMLAGFGQQQLIYPILIIIITRELGPLLTAFIVIARSATAIATEIAGMVISHEVEAYISVGVDPIEHLAVPRFLGVIISMIMLNIYFSVFGLAGSFVVAQIFNPMPVDYYFSNLLYNLTVQDLLMLVIKSIVFGAIISTCAIIQGLSVERASTEIPVAGLKAVSNAFAGCIIAAIILSAIYYIVMV